MIDMSKPWITTFTGKHVNPLDLRPEDIDIEDIAHHLATQNRFCGALAEPISIAQHSVNVSLLVEGTGLEMQGLLHDGAEAYLGDMTRWLKRSPEMRAYCLAEDRAQLVIYEKFRCAPRDTAAMMSPAVRDADNLIVVYEARQGLANALKLPGFPVITPETEAALLVLLAGYTAWPWQVAESRFLRRFEELQRRRGAGAGATSASAAG